MITKLIRWSIANRGLVLLAAVALAIAGTISLLRIPLDAIPDLSPTEVIIKASWPGQPPQIVQNQVTYPLTTTMLAVPGATAVRGDSFFGDSFVYVVFADGTNLYWARNQVVDYLSEAASKLPQGVHPVIGPDADGADWIYEYALTDPSGHYDLGQLTALQNWFLRYRLKTVPNVSEVATIGGMQNAWQIVLDPQALAARDLTVRQVETAVKAANGATGGSVIEQGEAQMMVTSVGYLQTRADFARIPIATGKDGVPIVLRDIARIQRAPIDRHGIAELDGQGQVVGGIVIMRYHKNALQTIKAVKARLAELQKSLPPGVRVVTTYDRSKLIHRAVTNIGEKLIEEFIIVALVCVLFLGHLRSSLVAIITLPLGILAAFLVMDAQGVSANLMSLAGIAIAVGEMVDAAVVMIENAHKHFETWRAAHPGRHEPRAGERWELVTGAMTEVGPACFVSLLVITFSFVPVFALGGEEGKLFDPLAFTKTYSVAAAVALSVTLVPVLIGYLVRGRIPAEHANPVNRFVRWIYQPLLAFAMRRPWVIVAVAVVVLATALLPVSRLGTQFMPPLDEGTLLYMPTALPGLSAGKAAQLLQQTDRMLKTVPEVAHVFGVVGRSNSPTDNAPLNMFDTTITFKPETEWPPGMTMAKLRAQLNAAVHVPGLVNLFVFPIRSRTEMLVTGIKSPIGIKVLGPDVAELQRLALQIAHVAQGVPGITSAVADRADGGRYVRVHIRPDAAARYGLSEQQIQSLIATVVGGAPIGQTIQGLQRFPIVLRYPRTARDSVAALEALPIVAPGGAQITLGQVADLRVTNGPPMLASEGGIPSTTVFVDTQSNNLGGIVASLQHAIAQQVTLPAGYTLQWAGQFQALPHAKARMYLVVPVTILIVFLLVYLIFRDVAQALIILATVPLGLVGGLWLVWLLGYAVSVATVVGFIGLAGITCEFGVILVLYMRQAWQRCVDAGEVSYAALDAAVHEGALLRVRPIAMTVVVILAGLLPIMVIGGTGSLLARTITAPMVGGMVTSPILSMLFIPAAFQVLERWRLRQRNGQRLLQPEENDV
ncbi:MAG TPA: CusA/CzcA family heavy metal efflux RND transporter [Rhodanobacteraceae bacterium]